MIHPVRDLRIYAVISQTITRTWGEVGSIHQAMANTGSAVTTLSTIGMTVVKARQS